MVNVVGGVSLRGRGYDEVEIIGYSGVSYSEDC